MDTEEFLAHYGVKGMRWGKRKSAASSNVKPSKDHKEVAKLRNKSAKELSNDELKTLTKRLQLEKQYKDLTPSKLTVGQKKTAALLAVAGTINAAVALGNSPLGKGIAKAFTATVVKQKQYANRNLLSIGS